MINQLIFFLFEERINFSFDLSSETIRNYGVGVYFDPNQNAESCRHVCFYNPLCKIYVFSPFQTTCFLLTSPTWSNLFGNFTGQLMNDSLSHSNLSYSFLKSTWSIENMHSENIEELSEIHDAFDSLDCFDNKYLSLCHGTLEGI